MTPEELIALSNARAANTGLLVGGGAAPQIPQSTPDMRQLLAGLEGSYNQLLAQTQQNDAMGINPQIIQGQQQNQLASIDAANSILSSPAYLAAIGPAAQNWVIDPNSPAARQRDSLITNMPQPQDFKTPGMYNAALRDQNRAIDNANFWANSSFYGGGLRYKTPEELQNSMNSGILAQLGGAKDAMKGVDIREMVNPDLLAKYGSLLQANQASANTLAGTQATANAAVEAAKVKGQADIQAEQIKARGASALTKNTKAQLEQEISGNQGMQANLQNMGSAFNPDWFTLQGRARIKVLNGKDYVGLANDQDKKDISEWTEFQKQTEQMFNQYRKNITGAAASNQELDRLRQSIFNMDLSPTQARSAMLDLMAEMNMKTTIAQGILQRGLESGQEPSVKPGTPEFARMVDNLYSSKSLGENKDRVRAALIKMYPQLDPTADDNGNPVNPAFSVNGTNYGNMSLDQLMAERARRNGGKI